VKKHRRKKLGKQARRVRRAAELGALGDTAGRPGGWIFGMAMASFPGGRQAFLAREAERRRATFQVISGGGS
jgi:hypothetical protein